MVRIWKKKNENELLATSGNQFLQPSFQKSIKLNTETWTLSTDFSCETWGAAQGLTFRTALVVYWVSCVQLCEWPWLSLMLCSCCLEILNNIYMYIFNQGALHFHFVLGPPTNLADLSHVIFSHYSWGRCIEYKEFGMKEIDTIALDGRSLKITKTLPIVYFKSVCFLFQIIIAVLEAEISDPAIFHDMI